MSNGYFHPDPIGQLMGAYFNQDSADFYGPTIEDVMAGYLRDGSMEDNLYIGNAIRTFIADHPIDLEEVFEQEYCSEFDPSGAGFTARTFLERLLVLIEEHIAKLRASISI